MTKNEQNIHSFAEQFEPALKPVRTQRVNGIAYPDAWQCSLWDAEKNMGVTCVAYEGQLHAFVEGTGRTKDAHQIGRAMAEVMGRAANG